DPHYYIQFQKHTNLKKALAAIKKQYGLSDENVHLHTILMAAGGITDKDYMKDVYPVVGVLFLLIMAAGVFMISGSMNSNVAQRLQFFGMLRCIGASKSQIIRFVRLEALNWCKTAVPIGSMLGIITTWAVNVGLKCFVGGELSDIPVFTVSAAGILCGVAIGVATVFLAAQAPAKRAAKVSPVAAVTGNAGDTKQVRHAVNMRFGKIETALGIHHAVSAKKNLLLLTGSFALSIILFLCFSVLIALVDCMLPQKASSPDLDIASADHTNSVDASLLDEIKGIDGVAHAFGRRVCFDMPAAFQKEVQSETIDLMSYDDYQLELLAKDSDLRTGSNLAKMYEDSHSVLVIWDQGMTLEIGDLIDVGDETLEIVGMLKYSPFSNDGRSGGKINVISTEETFTRLTGITDYAIIDVQMKSRSTNETNDAVEQIRRLSGAYTFRDRREESISSMYYA
ncbi:MAG: ABC transporter permease, partial [Lachnospiraceae bacterium]|nr:ABC transporter permease [Lachnospiraceae bacterium]